MLGNFACFSCRLLTCSKLTLKKKKKKNQEYYHSGKGFGSRSGRQDVGPDLGPNCLKKIISRRQKSQQAIKELKHWSQTLRITKSGVKMS